MVFSPKIRVWQNRFIQVGFKTFTLHTHILYLSASAPIYLLRPLRCLSTSTVFCDSVTSVTSHLARRRNFNDFAADVNTSTLLFVTPNDDHNTAVECAGQWVDYWPAPLPDDTNTNAERTLIFLTFDETGTCAVNSCILTRGAVPKSAGRTVDSTYYTHYSSLSTVEANWSLGSFGRGDMNKTLSNVYSFANATGYTNLDIALADNPTDEHHGHDPGLAQRAVLHAHHVCRWRRKRCWC